MRIIGLDIHRVVAEAVALDGTTVTRLGRIGMTREHLAAFAATLNQTAKNRRDLTTRLTEGDQ